MRTLKLCCYALYHRLKNSFSDSIEYFFPYITYLALIGLIGFPLYYYIWRYAFPQPYENLTLRLIGCALCLGLILMRFWPNWMRQYLEIYWLLTIIYTLPFYFIYMLLMNNGSTAWAMSTMAGLSLLILVVYDWLLFTCLFIIGFLLALLAYALTANQVLFGQHYLGQLPAYLFLMVTSCIVFHYPQRLKQAKLKVLTSIGAEISHELRTPLITIQNHAYGLDKNLPTLLHAYQLAKHHQLISKSIRPDVLKILEHSIRQIENEVKHANTVIDMLLMNMAKTKVDAKTFNTFSMASIIKQAIARYPFDSDQERDIVKIHLNKDFQFLGSDILMMHVIFNLIKNALVFTNNTPKASIIITLDNTANENHVYFRDNGQGISWQHRRSIFESFYSSGNQAKGAGTGIGLAFCKKVLTSFEASISCHSELGVYTEFVLSFPPIKQGSH